MVIQRDFNLHVIYIYIYKSLICNALNVLHYNIYIYMTPKNRVIRGVLSRSPVGGAMN